MSKPGRPRGSKNKPKSPTALAILESTPKPGRDAVSLLRAWEEARQADDRAEAERALWELQRLSTNPMERRHWRAGA